MPVYRKNKTREISFPLGGIGTGCVGLSGNGELVDWEIFNSPNKGSYNSYTSFAVRARTADGKKYARILVGDHIKDYMGQFNLHPWRAGYGLGPANMPLIGMPHFRDVTFRGEFPIAELTYGGEDFPAAIKLTAFSPFIPHDEDASGMPAAFFEFSFENKSDSELDFSIAFNLGNSVAGKASVAERGHYRGVSIVKNADPASAEYAELAVLTEAGAEVQPYWQRGKLRVEGRTDVEFFWKEFTSFERTQPRNYDTAHARDTASVIVNRRLAAGEKGKIRFVLAWYVPNNNRGWDPDANAADRSMCWKNYYATVYDSALTVAEKALDGYDELYRRTDEFRRALFSQRIDPAIKDVVASTLATLRSPTVIRLEDGTLWGWEGVFDTYGSCYGSCSHVWGYAYALPLLFPALARSMTKMHFTCGMWENGSMQFRLPLPKGRKLPAFDPLNIDKTNCADGQMVLIVAVYRDWKFTGYDAFMREMYPYVKRSLEFAWNDDTYSQWDHDRDGVMEGCQHHTLDHELLGPNAWIEGLYLAALKAASAMAEHVGDSAMAEECRRLYENGSEWTEKNLFNGSYYIQKIDLSDKSIVEKHHMPLARFWNEETGELQFQLSDGCEIDQLLGQWHARLSGLGDIFDARHRHTAAKSLAKNNIKCMRDVVNPWRIFAINDEVGAVILTFPEGSHPPVNPPFSYSECMNGFEFALAGTLISEGLVSEGVGLIRAVRDRYDGEKRNPFNEIECGSNYSRSLAAFAILPLLSGFKYDMTAATIGFDPVTDEPMRVVWSAADGWGTFERTANRVRIVKKSGSVPFTRIELPFVKGGAAVKANRGSATIEDGVVTVSPDATIITVTL